MSRTYKILVINGGFDMYILSSKHLINCYVLVFLLLKDIA